MTRGAAVERACEGKVALVTGASRGIGRAVAARLAAEGADVAICSRPTPGFEQLGTLEQARTGIAELGGRVVAIPFDLVGASTDTYGLERLGFDGSVVVNRKDWCLVWNAALEIGTALLGDDVRLELEVSAVRTV